MVEYIERDKAIANSHEYNLGGSIYNTECAVPVNAIKAIPAADVQPVMRGKWEVAGIFDDIARCSNCRYMFPLETAMREFCFCPNCGADMRIKNR